MLDHRLLVNPPGGSVVTVKGSRYSEGLLTDRPAADAVEPGTMYFSVDTGALDYSDGSVWAPVP